MTQTTATPATATPATGPATIRPAFHHINLKTTRLQAMIDWYGTVLGMTPTFQFEGGAWLTNDGANHRIALLTSPHLMDPPDRYRLTGLHHSAFEYADMGELLDSYDRLQVQGILPHASLDHGMTTSFYYEDPDGNSAELQSDNFGAWSESTEFMHSTAEFAANPIGVAVDPAKLLAAREAGASFGEIHRRAYAGEFAPSEPLDLHVPL